MRDRGALPRLLFLVYATRALRRGGKPAVPHAQAYHLLSSIPQVPTSRPTRGECYQALQGLEIPCALHLQVCTASALSQHPEAFFSCLVRVSVMRTWPRGLKANKLLVARPISTATHAHMRRAATCTRGPSQSTTGAVAPETRCPHKDIVRRQRCMCRWRAWPGPWDQQCAPALLIPRPATPASARLFHR